MRRGLARGALDLLMALVADEQDVVVARGEALGLVVHLGDQRAGGVDRLQGPPGGLLVHGRGHAVGREDDDRPLGDLLGLLDEDRAAILQGLHDVGVVHDLLADVDGRAVLLKRLLDRLDRAVDPRAVTARLGYQDTTGRGGLGNHVLNATCSTIRCLPWAWVPAARTVHLLSYA